MNRCAALGPAAALAAALSVVSVGGCAGHKKSATSTMPPTGEQIEAIRSSYKTAFPNAAVGVVTAVLADKPYALVGQMDPAAVHENQVVSFLDGMEKVVANGKVVKVDDSGVTVMFDAGARRPAAGDVAVRF